MKRLVFDIDGTLTKHKCASYADATPRADVVERLRQYKADGFEIALYTSRNMRTHNCSVGKIAAKTLPIILEWLDKNSIPYDEIHVGKPWCGTKGFYVDDRAIRPSEFLKMDRRELNQMLDNEVVLEGGGA